MKVLSRVLAVAIVCSSFVGTSALAEPASVLMARGDETTCKVLWLSVDLEWVLLPANFDLWVDTNNDRGNALLQCNVDYDWSQPVMAIDPVTGLFESVWLATVDQFCSILGFTPCQRGKNGPMILSHENTAGYCYHSRYGVTRNWQRVLNPTGSEKFVCHWPDHGAN